MQNALRILIVEDLPTGTELMERALRKAELQFIARSVGNEAQFRKALQEFGPDLVLADWAIPNFEGMAALRIKQELAPAVPFIAVSAPANEQEAAGCIEAGADDYLLKDRLTRLGSAVRSALEKKRSGEERRRAQQDLRASERRFRALIENSTDGIALIDPKATILYTSASTRRILGYATEALVGHNAFEFMHPDDVNAARHLFARVLREPGRAVTVQSRYRHRDGSWRRIETIAKNLLDEPSVRAIVSNYRDITERWEVQELIKTSLRQKEVLLKELHHRVKNNLQVISSLLQLRSVSIKDPQAIELLRESQSHIRSMALVHEKLYRSNQAARIDFAEYLRALVPELFRSYLINPESVSFRVKGSGLHLGADTAIPCGLIVNELVTNALKHSGLRENGRKGEIEIELLREGDCVSLVVRDNGVGLPKDIDFARTGSFGLGLVRTMAEQMGATIEIRTNPGTTFRFTFAMSKD